jgi:hypothetical protein
MPSDQPRDPRQAQPHDLAQNTGVAPFLAPSGEFLSERPARSLLGRVWTAFSKGFDLLKTLSAPDCLPHRRD